MRKFSQEEYGLYQANIDKVKGRNEALYARRFRELEDERKLVLNRGCRPQAAATEQFEPRFRAILDLIDELNQKLGKEPAKKVQSLRSRFVRDETSQTVREVGPYELKTARAQLREHTADLGTLEKEYREAFKVAADSEWEREVKAKYKENIDVVKEELADKNAEDIRKWIKENANNPIFMAIAERIGYDATGRKDPINDLHTIYNEYRRFSHEDPGFFA